jgi:hypothetical protein
MKKNGVDWTKTQANEIQFARSVKGFSKIGRIRNEDIRT